MYHGSGWYRARMTVIRCQVVLNPNDDPEDHIVNTWHISPEALVSSEDAAEDFFGDVNAFYQGMDTNMSTYLNGKVPLFSAYDLAEDKPRQPVFQSGMDALASSSSQHGAREVAICLSYKSTYISGQNPQRRRGRIYLGPLRQDSIDGSTGLFASALVSNLVTAAQTLLAAMEASTEYKWIVYSPTTDTAGDGSAGIAVVTEGWVDNAPDIQRRRGVTGTKSYW